MTTQLLLIEHCRNFHNLPDFGSELLQRLKDDKILKSETKKEVCFTVSNVGLQGKPVKPSSIKKAVEESTKKGIRFTVSGNNGNLIEGKIVNSLDHVNFKSVGGKSELGQTPMTILQKAEPEDIGQVNILQETQLETGSTEDGNEGFDTVHVLLESDGSIQQIEPASDSAAIPHPAGKENGSGLSKAVLDALKAPGGPELGTGSGSQAQTSEKDKSQSKPKDFTFILKTDAVQKKSLSYNKISFQCFHCKYKTASKTALGKHMDKIHPSVFDVHKDLDIKHTVTSSANENTKLEVLTMSEYERTLKPKRGRKPGTKRKRGIEKQDIPGVFNCTECDKVIF